MSAASARGLRNNNPFNIRIVAANKWQGKDVPSRDAELARAAGVKKPRQEFETFADPIMGLRAGFALIVAHYDRRKANTIRKLVKIWAPENGDRNGDLPGGEYRQNTEAYVNAVAKDAGFGPDDLLDFHTYAHLRPVGLAMMKHELGGWPTYTSAQIDAALNKIGVNPPLKPLTQTRTVRGGQVATAGIGLATGVQLAKDSGLVDMAQQAAETVQGLQPMFPVLRTALPYAPYILLGLAVAGIGLMLYARWQDRERGLR